jgi:hypothetical protein
MLVLHGYIDDSTRGDIFVLSCLQADVGMWAFVELAWLGMLERVNARLKQQGRKELSRYHATDCQSHRREFEGWTTDEEIELTKMIVKIFTEHKFHTNAYSLDLKHLQEEIPETKTNPKGFAYVFLLHHLMLEMCDGVLRKHKNAIMGMTHDHCDCDSALLEAFNQMIDDPAFKCRERFTTLVPARWQHCIPLQPADLIAYENYKETLRRKQMSSRPRRTPLRLILDADPPCIGGNLKCFNRESLSVFKQIMDEMNEETKDRLLRTARIRTLRPHDAATGDRSSQRDKSQARRREGGESKKAKRPKD